jgi:hypothetical protein
VTSLSVSSKAGIGVPKPDRCDHQGDILYCNVFSNGPLGSFFSCPFCFLCASAKFPAYLLQFNGIFSAVQIEQCFTFHFHAMRKENEEKKTIQQRNKRNGSIPVH